MHPGKNLFNQMLKGMEDLEVGCVNYINIPYRLFSEILLKIGLFMLLLYILSVNVFMIAFLLPGYLIAGYLHYKYWLFLKGYGCRLFSVMFVFLFFNFSIVHLAKSVHSLIDLALLYC